MANETLKAPRPFRFEPALGDLIEQLSFVLQHDENNATALLGLAVIRAVEDHSDQLTKSLDHLAERLDDVVGCLQAIARSIPDRVE